MKNWIPITALVLVLGGLLGTPAPVQAQSERAGYTMTFRGVALDAALARVVEETRVSLVYDSELVQGKEVYCSIREATEEALLKCLLSDAGIDFYQTSAGTYVLTPAPRQSPQRGDLTGVIVDGRTGEPLPHAHVLLASANTGVASDEAGRFRLPDLMTGTHRLVATHLGYEPTVDSVHVPPGDSVRHRVALSPKPIASEPVIVEGVTRRAPDGALGASTLSAGALAEGRRMGTPDALGRAGTLMGVHLQRPVADLHVQGGGTGEHQVRLDGMPIRNPVTLRRLLGAFSPLALDRLTVHKAGFGVEHGSTISGVVAADHALSSSAPTVGEVKLDPTSVNAEGHGSVDLGHGQSAQVRVAARSSVWDVYRDPTLHRLLLDWNVVDPLLLSSYFDTETIPQFEPATQTAAVGFSDVHAATRIDLGPYQSLSVSGYRGRNHLRTQFVAREPTGMLTQDRYAWANTAGQVRLDWMLGARASASVQLRASEHRVNRGYQMTYGSPNPEDGLDAVIDTLRRALDPSRWPGDRNRVREIALETTGSYAVTTRHHLKGAVEVSRLTSRFRLGGRFFRPTAFRGTRWQVGGYLRDAVSIGASTTLTAGTRLTYIPVRRTLYAEPRMSLRQEGTLSGVGPYTVRLASGLYRQYINRFDASSTSPTAILPSMRFWLPVGATHAPPRAYHAAVEGQVQPHDRWTVTGEAYYKHYARLLQLDYAAFQGDSEAIVPPSSAVAATNGYAVGGGLALTRDGPHIESTLRYDWSRSRRRFPSQFNGRMVPAPWSQPHQLSLSTTVAATEALDLHLRTESVWGRTWGYRRTYYDYFGPASTDEADFVGVLENPSAHTLPPRVRMDVGGSYSVQWNGMSLEMRLDVVNVLDRRNSFDWSVRATEEGAMRTTRRLPGRRFVGSLSFRY